MEVYRQNLYKGTVPHRTAPQSTVPQGTAPFGTVQPLTNESKKLTATRGWQLVAEAAGDGGGWRRRRPEAENRKQQKQSKFTILARARCRPISCRTVPLRTVPLTGIAIDQRYYRTEWHRTAPRYYRYFPS